MPHSLRPREDARAAAWRPYGRGVLVAGEANAALKPKGASGALAGSEAAEAPVVIEA